ncbi:MAG: phosphoglycolate phosphatase [Parasphingorhabdus sp.]|jgi:phosphoglycolate phosphatase
MRSTPCVAIDLDGTLIDSVPDLTQAANSMLEQMDEPACAEQDVRKWVGNGIPRLVERVLTGSFDGIPDQQRFEQGLPLFFQSYKNNVCDLSCCYPGVEEGLGRLAEAGLMLACVTNKSAAFTLPLLEQMGIIDAFELVVSGDTLAEKKPHPAPLLHIANELRQNPSECTLIGDSVSDIKAAQAATFQSIVVTYGYNQGFDLSEFKPDHMVNDFDAAVEIVLRQVI